MSQNIIRQSVGNVTERGAVTWIQIVASKSGGAAHTVRCFEGGLMTCDCPGFMWGGKCSHIPTARQQEAREALAAAEIAATTPARPVGHTDTSIRGAAAYADLIGAEWAVR